MKYKELSVETGSKMNQMLKLSHKDFKTATRNTFKSLKENTYND